MIFSVACLIATPNLSATSRKQEVEKRRQETEELQNKLQETSAMQAFAFFLVAFRIPNVPKLFQFSTGLDAGSNVSSKFSRVVSICCFDDDDDDDDDRTSDPRRENFIWLADSVWASYNEKAWEQFSAVRRITM